MVEEDGDEEGEEDGEMEMEGEGGVTIGSVADLIERGNSEPNTIAKIPSNERWERLVSGIVVEFMCNSVEET